MTSQCATVLPCYLLICFQTVQLGRFRVRDLEPDGLVRIHPLHDCSQQGSNDRTLLAQRSGNVGRRQERLERRPQLDLELCRVGSVRASSRDSLDFRVWRHGRVHSFGPEAKRRVAPVRQVDWKHTPSTPVQFGIPPVPVELQRSGGREDGGTEL